MAKSIHQVQQKIKNLKQQINDTLHLTSLNNQSIICLASNNQQQKQSKQLQQAQQKLQAQPKTQQKLQAQPKTQLLTQAQSQQSPLNISNIILKKHTKFQSIIKHISQLLQKRPQHHLNYLIVRQIQGEQQSVRRDRLNQYQDKIYDQRRLISDKQVFLQSLYRPKKQRPQSMTSEQFQQLRAKERPEEEKFKLYSLDQQINKLTAFHQKLSQIKIRHINILNHQENKKSSQQASQKIINNPLWQDKIKDQEFQKTKAHSLQTVNLSAFNNLTDKIEKIIEQTDLNTILDTSPQQNSNKEISNTQKLPIKNHKIQKIGVDKQFSISQKVFDNQKSRCFSIQINKLMTVCEKNLSKQDGKQKIERIKQLIRRIELKKEDNSVKRKKLREIQRQNVHMSLHLKKVKQNYKEKLSTLNMGKINTLDKKQEQEKMEDLNQE